jgi:transcriptional regulator with XRE-family HTH domain
MSKRASVFGYAWRGFRLLRHRRELTPRAAARRAQVSEGQITTSENRQGNVDFLVAGRLLNAYNASIVDLGFMTQIAEKHLAEHGATSLNASNIPAILADFERLRKQATRLNVPMPDPVGLLREIDLRIVPIERHFQAAFLELVALRRALPTMSWLLGTEPEKGTEVEQKERGTSRLPKWFSGGELGGKEPVDES